jgi:hypothetical protein
MTVSTGGGASRTTGDHDDVASALGEGLSDSLVVGRPH